MTDRRRRWIHWGGYAAVWTVIGLITATQSFLAYSPFHPSLTWGRIVVWELPAWYAWGVLAPVILRLGRRFRLEGRHRAFSLLLHFGASVTVAAAHLALLTWLGNRVPGLGPRNLTWGDVAGAYFHYEFLVYWLILGAGNACEYYAKYKEKELTASRLEHQLVQAQLQALKMQLQPHFLFNTLHSVAVLIRKGENRAAIGMISGLGDLLRYVLDRAPKQEVSLKEELDFVNLYLTIQKIRFQDRLGIRWHIAPETLEAAVPSLILQPLVENAVSHGISMRAEAGLIELKAVRKEKLLSITIRDDGPGLASDWDSVSRAGVGIANTRARLQQFFGTDYRLELSNSQGTLGGGTVVSLAIPFRPFMPGSSEDGQMESSVGGQIKPCHTAETAT